MIPRFACLLALAAVLPAHAAEPPAQRLFDGSTLGGWQGNGALWRVEDGAITGEIATGTALDHNEWLFWDGEVADFELTLEWRISGGPSANSGIQIRCQRRPDGTADGLQADLDDGTTWLGRLYDEHGRALLMERGTHVAISPDGRRWTDEFAPAASFAGVAKKDAWNTYRIRATGPRVALWINGVFFGSLVDHDAKAAEWAGRLAFQLHSGPGPAKVQFRNVRLTPLGRTAGPVGAAAEEKGEALPSFKATDATGRVLNFDFEAGTLADWTAEGDAWAGQPVKGDTVTERKPGEASRHAGEWWIGTYEPRRSDAGTGTLTSAPFVVNHPWASFLVGAGGDVSTARVEILDDGGKVFHTATGKAVEDMHREVVDLRPLAGKTARLRLIDQGTRGWDHINFDDFLLHDEPPPLETAATGRGRQSPVLWHLQPNPAGPSTVKNEDAQKAVASMRVVQGFRADLVAAEPDVVQPIAFAIDERGRLWVLEGLSYPNKQPDGMGRDRIVILEDADGDGAFETRKIFAEGINLASGLEVGFGGVFVGAAPELLFYADKDHDDRADGPPEVLLDGWGFQDTHETLNSFTWGPDGWLYGNQGVFTNSRVGKPGTPDDQRVAVRAAVWRWHPVRRVFEVFSHGGSNQWGLDYTATGDFFMTHCRSFFGGGGTTYAIRNGHFWNQANGNYAPFIAAEAPDFAPELKNYLPASAKYDSGEGGAGKPGTTAVYGGHSHVGTLIYQGDNWPPLYRGHLFTHNLHGHQMNHQTLERDGAGWEAMHGGWDMLWVPDARYIAVDLQTGPDGAVYSIDWCDQQHCHTPIEEKWDRSNGRVHRLAWVDTWKPAKVDLSRASDAELVALQTHVNDWFGRTARRLLQERAAAGLTTAETIAAVKRLTLSDDAALVLRGLWTLHQMGALDDATLTVAAAHADEHVRAWAVHLGTEDADALRLPVDRLVASAERDPSPVVRLALASALPALPADARWAVAEPLAAHESTARDRFLPKLVWSGLATVAASNPARAVALADRTPLGELATSLRWQAAQSPAGREALFSHVPAPKTLRLAAHALRAEAALPAPKGWPEAEKALTASADAAVRTDVEQLAAVFGDGAVLARLRGVLADRTRPLPERKSAFAVLRRTRDEGALPVFAVLLSDAAFRAAAIPELARSDDAGVARQLVTLLPNLPPSEQTAALATLTSRPSHASVLVAALEDGSLPKSALSTLHVRQIRTLGDAALNDRLTKVWGSFNDSSEAARATMAKLRKVYAEAPLWAYETAAGKAVFDRACATCHTMGASERKLGPDLAGSWRNGVDYFLENIVDPNAVVGDDFQLVILTKKDGSVVSGSISAESDTAVTIRSLTDTVTVPKADIATRQKLPQSLMPPGLLETMPERDAIALLKYLTTAPGR